MSIPTSSSKGAYRRLLSYAARYKSLFVLSVIGFALYATMEALLLRSLEFFVDQLEAPGKDPIWIIPVAIVILSIVRGIGYYFGNFSLSKVGLNVVNDIRKQLFAHMVFLPTKFYDGANSGELVSLIIYNIEQVTASVTTAFKILIRDGFSVIGFLALLFYYNWKLTLVFFAIAPILALLVYIASRYFRRVSKHIQEAIGRITHITTEAFQSMPLVKSYRGEKFEVKRFNKAADENLKFKTKFERVNSLQVPILHTVIAIDLAVIFLLVLLFWEGTAGEAVAYVGAAAAIAKPFRQLSSVNSIIQKGLAAADTIFSTLDTQKEIDSGTITLKKPQGHIEFENVNFSYDGDNIALDGINLKILPGETVAFVGSSGSGKTTLANMLLRFYQADHGKISIDNQPINDVTLESLRRNIAVVNQHTYLFNESVCDNIAYAIEKSEQNVQAVQVAAENAYAMPFIEKLDEQLNSVIGEAGSKLSGGQRQRLSIARALYKDASILILDEATSALDNESEKKIQLALEQLKENRTTLIIAHRLSTIEKADRIVVMDRGKILETGTHSELIAKNGIYTNLHKTQFS